MQRVWFIKIDLEILLEGLHCAQGVQEVPSQNSDTLYADNFEAGAFEEQQMQAEVRSALPLSAGRWTLQRNQWAGVPPRELHSPAQGNSVTGEATGIASMPR